MADEDNAQPFPGPLASGNNVGGLSDDELAMAVWQHLKLKSLDKPYSLPPFDPNFGTISGFVNREIKVQAEMMRSDLSRKAWSVQRLPKPAIVGKQDPEKHFKFCLPRN